MRVRLLVALALVLTTVILPATAGRLSAEGAEETAQVTGPLKMVEVNPDGKNAGKVYFSIKPTEGGAPSDFHVDASDLAAVQLLCAARITKLKIIVTYKPDFSVTQIRL
jgi:hypothetical protein